MADRDDLNTRGSLATARHAGGYDDRTSSDLSRSRPHDARAAAASTGPCQGSVGRQNQTMPTQEPRSSIRATRGFFENADIRAEVIGRYTLRERIASGGMASVYLGSLAGAADFSRVVAIKRMHPQYSTDSSFVTRFRDEAWLGARLLHPSIVQTLDVVEWDGELLLVMEYVDGVNLKTLCLDSAEAGHPLPLNITVGIMVPVLHGLHAAHEATDDEGRPLGLVHRDFSPHNIIIGRDGHAKILDFGIAKVRTHHQLTSVGHLTGKFAYLSPEQVRGERVDRRTDVFAAGIVLWEALTGQRLFREPNDTEAATIKRVLRKTVPPPSSLNPKIPHHVDDIVLRALRRDPDHRHPTARDLALELEATLPLANPSTISNCLSRLCAPRLAELSRLVANTRRQSAFVARAHCETSDVSTVVLGPVDFSAREQSQSAGGLPSPVSRWTSWRKVAAFAVPLAMLGLAAWLYGKPAASPPARYSAVGPRSSGTAPSVATAVQPVAPAPSAQETARTPATLSLETELGAVNLAASSVPDPPPRPSSPAARVKPPGPVAQTTARETVAKPAERRDRAAARVPPPIEPVTLTPSNCDPPTYLDAKGIRHFKDGCI